MEHSAVLDGARVHRDGFRDELVPAEEALGQLQSDAGRLGLSAWDASDGARPGEGADAAHQRRLLPAGGDAGRSADRARVALAQDASFPPELPLVLLEPAEQGAGAGPYIPAVGPFAEQSCAAPVFAAQQPPAE